MGDHWAQNNDGLWHRVPREELHNEQIRRAEEQFLREAGRLAIPQPRVREVGRWEEAARALVNPRDNNGEEDNA